MSEEHLDLHIEGMTCAACSNRIEKVLNKMPGVKAEVSLLEHRARVSGCSVDDAIAAVRRAGYDAWPAQPRDNPAAHQAVSGIEQFRLWFSVAALAIMLIEMAGMLTGRHVTVPALWQLALASVMQTVIAWPFYISALRALRAGGANMETLISIGTLSAYFWSVAMMVNGVGDAQSTHRALYFETSVVVLAMVRIGRHLETRARGRALQALSELMQIDQSAVLTLDESSGQWMSKTPQTIAAGSFIRIKPGQPISLDAVITEGETEIDESSMTGESLPVAKGVGATVYAGCLNLSEEITAKVLAGFESSRRAMIGERILSALSSRAPIAAMADRIASVFVPVVLAIAATTAIGHVVTGAALADAISHAVAVQVVACPCALGLATPAALAAGLARGAQLGWLFRSADALQRAAEVDHVVLDKTGTLTSGRPKLIAIAGKDGNGLGNGALRHTDLESATNEQPWPDWLAAASSAERGIEHPLAGALLSYVAGKPLPACRDVHHHPGQGVVSVIADGAFAGQTITVGKPEPRPAHPELETLHPDASAVDIVIDSRWQGRLWIADSMRPDAQGAITALNSAGINAMILSGDRLSAVSRAARLLGGIDAKGAQTPEDKAALLDQYKRDGRKVAMIGDGINDASAMAHAHLGIAMASGANITLQTADVTVSTKTPLLGSVQSLMLARATISRVKENLTFAFVFNIAAIPMAAFGVLSPTVAGSAMALSSAAVVANAARVLNWKTA